MPNKLYSYQQVASATSSRFDQIVQLYDGAIKFLMLAAGDIKKKDAASKAAHINRGLAIVDYLRAVLDLEKGGEVAQLLDNVYEYVTHEALMASAWMDAARLEGPIHSLREIRSAWHQIANSPDVQAALKAPPETRVNSQTPSPVRLRA